MANLFIIFMPFQLFTAQQIIRQEKLKNNVIILGYRSLFDDIYDMMFMEELWNEKIDIEDYAKWVGNHLNSYKEMCGMRRNFKYLKYVCEKYNVETIYLGEVLNQSCRFTALWFSHLNYKIVFFEEGTSHYLKRPDVPLKSFSGKVKGFLLDYCYFLPCYGIKFSSWHSAPKSSYDSLPMDKRFSMIPFHNKPFDVRLNVEPMFSPKLKSYVETNISADINEKRILLMTDPMYELLDKEHLYIYYDTIKTCVQKIGKERMLYVKFHPREIKLSRDNTINIIRDTGIQFKVLSEEVNVSVEYYLQKYHFEKIYFFNASTYFYNGYAFPKTDFVTLLPELYEKAGANGASHLQEMGRFLNLIRENQKLLTQ